MGNALEKYFNPTCSVTPPPEVFLSSDWYPPILRRQELFVAGFRRMFGEPDVYDWYRYFQEQEKLFAGGSSKAAVSEHNFAAALDMEIPEEFHEKNTVDFISKLGRIDPEMRIGWLDYQKPNKKFTFFHAGWGFLIPFDDIKKFVYTHFQDPRALKIYQNINRCWKPGVQW
jgi:hypothetical protein